MIQRHVEPLILAGLADSPVVLLVGARQTGKSTLIQAPAFEKAKRRFITFDDANNLAAAKADPAGFLNAVLSENSRSDKEWLKARPV